MKEFWARSKGLSIKISKNKVVLLKHKNLKNQGSAAEALRNHAKNNCDGCFYTKHLALQHFFVWMFALASVTVLLKSFSYLSRKGHWN